MTGIFAPYKFDNCGPAGNKLVLFIVEAGNCLLGSWTSFVGLTWFNFLKKSAEVYKFSSLTEFEGRDGFLNEKVLSEFEFCPNENVNPLAKELLGMLLSCIVRELFTLRLLLKKPVGLACQALPVVLLIDATGKDTWLGVLETTPLEIVLGGAFLLKLTLIVPDFSILLLGVLFTLTLLILKPYLVTDLGTSECC